MSRDSLNELAARLPHVELNGFALPHTVERGRVGDRQGEFYLKTWGDRLLFCSANEPARLFAVTTPWTSGAPVGAFWRAEVAREAWGRFSLCQQSLTGAEAMDSAFAVISGRDGARWVREWCGGEWLLARGARALSTPFWHEKWQPPKAPASAALLAQLLARPFPSREREDQPMIWLRGSRAEWKRVLQACATLFFPLNPHRYDDIRVREGRHRFYFFAHAPFFASWMDGASRYGPWAVPEPWRSVLSRHFIGAGWKWSRRNKGDERLREGWKVAPRQQSVEIDLSCAPSQHERLEARLFLRDWLRDKLPPDEIETLLP